MQFLVKYQEHQVTLSFSKVSDISSLRTNFQTLS